MNLPGHRIVAWLGKAALKSHPLQTLRDCRASPKRAKRLECVRFIGAFRRARDGRGSWSQCTVVRPRGLSMNLLFGVPALAGPDRLKAGHRTDGTTQTGSWSQCMRKNERGLSMNRPGHRIGACFGKPALKTHALQTLRDCSASPNRAKRLECVRFIGAFPPARQRRNSVPAGLSAEAQ